MDDIKVIAERLEELTKLADTEPGLEHLADMLKDARNEASNILARRAKDQAANAE
ncbi:MULTISPECIES: hypothetical protein [unclassified Rhizobium]|uniref:hypothetical protein n=1 Tax=unclassified Rhizobium TaxID=2613769 RepID=UPI000AEBDCD6|nr:MULTISPECIES: hypothetical protein [unclassified Rhizobium]